MLVMIVLGYLILTLPAPPAAATPTQHRVELSLPTAVPPTATPGPPPAPLEVTFVPQEPVQGFSNCETYGFWGIITGVNGRGLAGTQVVVWQDQTGLLAVATTDIRGNYSLPLKDKTAPLRLWLQVYQNDIPVSGPVQLDIQVDCHSGFQQYKVDWQQTEP